MHSISKKTSWLSVILFGLFAISLLTPIGSIFGTYNYVPANDFRDHVAVTIQAKMAIDEGQFPIRVTPWQNEGLRYAEYQFYGVLPYTVSGYVYKYFMHSSHEILHNPFNALKLVLFLAAVSGAFFSYCLARLFTRSDVLAILSATAYLFSPYFILNIDHRGDYTEAFAQGVLPIALYYSFRMIYLGELKLSNFIFAAMGWFAVLTSHLITFMYGCLFFSLVTLAFFVMRLSNLKTCIVAAASLVYSWVLAAWYLVPLIVVAPYLAVGQGFKNGNGGGTGLTPTSIFNLFALRSGNGDISPSWPGMYTAIGWPILISFIVCLYYVIWPNISRNSKQYKLMTIITSLFIVALVMTWSWVNIWHFLPYFLSVGQYGYRFLAQIMWLGVILFVIAGQTIFGDQLDARHLVIGIFVICLAGASWIIKPRDGVAVSSLMNAPDILMAGECYATSSEKIPFYPGLQKYGFIQMPLVTIDRQLLLDRPVNLTPDLLSSKNSMVLQGVMLPESEPSTLFIKINGQVISSKQVKPNQILNWKVPLTQQSKSVSLSISQVFANHHSDPTPDYLNKILPILVNKFELVSNEISPVPILPAEQVRRSCQQNNSVTQCTITLKSSPMAVQLPVLYYPKMLSVLLDGKKINYQATYYSFPSAVNKIKQFDAHHSSNPFTLATIIVPAGKHTIVIKNSGIHWANMASLLAWLLLSIVAMYTFAKYVGEKFNAK